MERIRAFDPQAVGGRDPSLAATYLQSGSHRRRRKWTESAAGVRVFSIPHEVMHVVDHWAKPELGRDISSRPPVEFRLGTAAPEQSPLLPAMHEFLRTFVQERISTQRELLRLYAENER